MRPSAFDSGRRVAWLTLLITLALAGCGGIHTPVSASTTPPPVGVNLHAVTPPGAPKVINDTPNVLAVTPPASLRGAARREFRQGEQLVGEAGCLGCHVIGADGNHGPGPELTHVGTKLSQVQITRALIAPEAPMPSFRGLPQPKLRALTRFLADLR